MRKAILIKITISIIAIVCNVAFLCLLIYQVFKDLPTGSEIFIPLGIGLFLVLNVLAIALTFSAYKATPIYPAPAAGAGRAQAPLFKRSSKARLIGLATVILGCIGLGFWLGFRSHNPIESWKWQRVEQAKTEKFMGKIAPNVVAQTLDGTEWRLKDHRGKVVLIDFWATWCGPCVGSISRMKDIYEKYKSRDDFVMVGVSLDRDKQALVEFCKKQEIAWTQLFEEGKSWQNSIARAFEIRGIPSVWIIDKEENVVGINIHSARTEEIEKIIEKSLNKKQSISDR